MPSLTSTTSELLHHCAGCGEHKPRTQFYGRKKRSGRCKDCDKAKSKAYYEANPARAKANHQTWVEKNRDRVRAHQHKHRYGVTPEQFVDLPKVCQICGTKDNLVIDHDHDTGVVRGRLCKLCNSGLGYLGDSLERLQLAVAYLAGAPAGSRTP